MYMFSVEETIQNIFLNIVQYIITTCGTHREEELDSEEERCTVVVEKEKAQDALKMLMVLQFGRFMAFKSKSLSYVSTW